jgi:hypothetical protein
LQWAWAAFFFFLPFLMTRAVCIIVVKVRAVVAQPGHAKELQLQPVQLELERGLRIVDSQVSYLTSTTQFP